MPNIYDAFPSKYLKAGDLKGHNVRVTIERVEMEEVGQGRNAEQKLILYFKNKDRGLVLNKTNAMMVASAYGPETENWIGEAVTLKAEMVSFQGKLVQGLRIYPVAAPSAKPSAPAPPVQDEPPPYNDDDFVADEEPPF